MKKEKIEKKVEYSSPRKTWGFNPTTRIVRDKTKYSRKKKHKEEY